MRDLSPAAEAAIRDAGSPKVYTLGEVASHLGVPEDDLVILLPDAAIIVEDPALQRFTSAEVEVLEQLVRTIRQYHTESADGGDI